MLRRISGPSAGDGREIDRTLVIGRQGDLVVDDPEASREHAAVRPVADGVEVEDLSSANGTFVDDERVSGKVTLNRSARLRIGTTELKIEITQPQTTMVSAPGALPSPDVTVARPVSPPRAGAPPPGAGAPPPGAGAPPRGAGAPPPGAGPPAPRRRRPGAKGLIPIGVALIVVIVLGVVLLGGSSTKKTLGATVPKPQCAAHPPHLISDGFPEPPMVFSHAGVLDYTIKAQPTTIAALGRSWPAMGYNGLVPGPTFVVCPGDRVTLHLENKLPLDTNLHVHGLHVSSVGSGDNVFVDIHPFEDRTYQYQIPLDQTAGSFWYHPHYHPLVQPEVESGLAGGILVQGSLDDQLSNIPERLMIVEGGREVLGPPIKLPPKIAARLKPPPIAGPPVFIVNGVHNPTVNIQPGQLQRWRLVNGTSDRELRLAIPGVTFQLLAVDGNTLHNMIPQNQLLIGPGSRQEVLVQGPAAGTYPFITEKFQKCFKHCLDPFAGEDQAGLPDPQETLVTVRSSGATTHDPLPSGPLAYPKSLEDLRRAQVDVSRTLDFVRDQNLNVGTVTFPLNQKTFTPSRVDVTMKLNSVEQWTLVNPITAGHNEWHTFHIHQNPFQVISINGKPLDHVRYEDNVDMPPGSTIVIRMRPVDFVGKFVFHCHLLFHEDNGMMGVVQVLANPSPAQVQANRVLYMQPPDGRQLRQLIAAVNSGKVRFGSSAWSVYELYCHPLGGSVT